MTLAWTQRLDISHERFSIFSESYKFSSFFRSLPCELSYKTSHVEPNYIYAEPKTREDEKRERVESSPNTRGKLKILLWRRSNFRPFFLRLYPCTCVSTLFARRVFVWPLWLFYHCGRWDVKKEAENESKFISKWHKARRARKLRRLCHITLIPSPSAFATLHPRKTEFINSGPLCNRAKLRFPAPAFNFHPLFPFFLSLLICVYVDLDIVGKARRRSNPYRQE